MWNNNLQHSLAVAQQQQQLLLQLGKSPLGNLWLQPATNSSSIFTLRDSEMCTSIKIRQGMPDRWISRWEQQRSRSGWKGGRSCCCCHCLCTVAGTLLSTEFNSFYACQLVNLSQLQHHHQIVWGVWRRDREGEDKLQLGVSWTTPKRYQVRDCAFIKSQ